MQEESAPTKWCILPESMHRRFQPLFTKVNMEYFDQHHVKESEENITYQEIIYNQELSFKPWNKVQVYNLKSIRGFGYIQSSPVFFNFPHIYNCPPPEMKKEPALKLSFLVLSLRAHGYLPWLSHQLQLSQLTPPAKQSSHGLLPWLPFQPKPPQFTTPIKSP